MGSMLELMRSEQCSSSNLQLDVTSSQTMLSKAANQNAAHKQQQQHVVTEATATSQSSCDKQTTSATSDGEKTSKTDVVNIPNGSVNINLNCGNGEATGDSSSAVQFYCENMNAETEAPQSCDRYGGACAESDSTHSQRIHSRCQNQPNTALHSTSDALENSNSSAKAN